MLDVAYLDDVHESTLDAQGPSLLRRNGARKQSPQVRNALPPDKAHVLARPEHTESAQSACD